MKSSTADDLITMGGRYDHLCIKTYEVANKIYISVLDEYLMLHVTTGHCTNFSEDMNDKRYW